MYLFCITRITSYLLTIVQEKDEMEDQLPDKHVDVILLLDGLYPVLQVYVATQFTFVHGTELAALESDAAVPQLSAM